MTGSSRATLQSGESAERGRVARETVPRSAHGDWAPAPDRPDPIAVLTNQAATRVQELVPIRYGRMLVSPVHVLPRRRRDHGGRPRENS